MKYYIQLLILCVSLSCSSPSLKEWPFSGNIPSNAVDILAIGIHEMTFNAGVLSTNYIASVPSVAEVTIRDHTVPLLSGLGIVEHVGYLNVEIRINNIQNKTAIFLGIRFNSESNQLKNLSEEVLPMMGENEEPIPTTSLSEDALIVFTFCNSVTHTPRDCKSKESINGSVNDIDLYVDGTEAKGEDIYAGNLTLEVIGI
jgi:hypothetical protein